MYSLMIAVHTKRRKEGKKGNILGDAMSGKQSKEWKGEQEIDKAGLCR